MDMEGLLAYETSPLARLNAPHSVSFISLPVAVKAGHCSRLRPGQSGGSSRKSQMHAYGEIVVFQFSTFVGFGCF
jgi:hypothetical protein